MTFKYDGQLFSHQPVSLGSNGKATFATAALSVGTHTITVVYSGDSNFSSSTGTDSGSPQVVHMASSTTTLSSTANPSVTPYIQTARSSGPAAALSDLGVDQSAFALGGQTAMNGNGSAAASNATGAESVTPLSKASPLSAAGVNAYFALLPSKRRGVEMIPAVWKRRVRKEESLAGLW